MARIRFKLGTRARKNLTARPGFDKYGVTVGRRSRAGDDKMAEKEESRKKRPRSEELFFSGLKKRPVSPLNAPVWKYILLASAGCFLAWLLNRFFPAAAGNSKTILVAATALTAWAIAVRLLFIQTRAKVFWIVWLAVGLIPLAASGNSAQAWIGPTFFSFVFLLFRKYRPYGHLASKRQAALFGIGLVLLIMLIPFWPPRPASPLSASNVTPGTAAFVQTVQPQLPTDQNVFFKNILRFSLVSLRWFWFFSLFHLLVTIRLNFMKLKPKLAVAAVLLVIVPIILLIALGTGSLYITLGQSHAAGAKSLLEEWGRLAALDRDFVRTISPAWFSAEVMEGNVQSAGCPPKWLPELATGLGAPASPFGPSVSTLGFVFGRSDGLWLLGFSRPSSGIVSIRGCPIDETSLSKLADVLHSDVVLGLGNPLSFMLSESKVRETDLSREDLIRIRGARLEVRGVYRPVPARASSPQPRPASSASFLQSRIFFGITELDVTMREKGLWVKGSLILQTPRSLRTTLTELFTASSPMSTVVMAALIALGFLFLVLETLALIFGLRISGGITKAVRTMHRHLCCVAEGDLDSHIEIPNQDELGDLAASFNQMTAAIKQGREEAIARERLEKELETARGIQERLLPHRMPSVLGFEVSGTSLPSHEVGGDYFDFLDLPTGHLGVAIADVSGKGIPAALLMANLQASLRAQDLQPESVSVIASRLNGLLVQNTDERMFVTFFYGILDKMKATFTYTNAGHNPPMLLRANGKLLRLEEGGMLLGFLSDQSYVQAAVSLEPGDVLTLFTDGITEAVNPDSANRDTKYFGEEKLVEVLRANAGRSTADIQAAVLAAVAAHTHLAPPGDDMTLVVIKRTGGHEAAAYVS